MTWFFFSHLYRANGNTSRTSVDVEVQSHVISSLEEKNSAYCLDGREDRLIFTNNQREKYTTRYSQEANVSRRMKFSRVLLLNCFTQLTENAETVMETLPALAT